MPRGLSLVLLLSLLTGCSWPGLSMFGEPQARPPIDEIAPGPVADSDVASPAPTVTARLFTRPPALPARDPTVEEPACHPTLNEAGRVVVADRPQPLAFTRDQHYRFPKLRVWPYGQDTVLVADRPRRKVNQGTTPGGALWLVPCDGRAQPVVLHAEPGADFGNAALASSSLFYSARDGVRALNLETHVVRVVTTPPPLADDRCRALYGGRAPTHQIDLVRAIDRRGRLVIDRGSHCGFEGDWQGERKVIARAALMPDQA